MRDTKGALKWITDLMENNNIQYQIVGGLAAKAYGASRELFDFDLYVSGRDFSKICDLAKEFITWGPEHFKNESWDLEYVKFEYKNQKIEIGNSDKTKWFDSKNKKWVPEKIDYDDFETKEFKGVTIKVIPKEKLIEYKKRLNREVDIIDLEQMNKAP